MVDEKLLQRIQSIGFSHVQELDISTLQPREDIRATCADNSCGQYGKFWTCPPGCGTLDQCRQQISQYQTGILVQTVGQLDDEFDWDGMKATEDRHKALFSLLQQDLGEEYPDMLLLSAGTCPMCATCTYPDAPCRFPKKRISSMEAYGLLVLQVCMDNGMQYSYGSTSIAFIGCILFM